MNPDRQFRYGYKDILTASNCFAWFVTDSNQFAVALYYKFNIYGECCIIEYTITEAIYRYENKQLYKWIGFQWIFIKFLQDVPQELRNAIYELLEN